MWGIVLVWFSAVMFVHLGLGDTLAKALRCNFVLFRCSKCMSFWATLGYSTLCTTLPAEAAVATAFLAAYLALWADLVLAKLADIYENLYHRVATETEEEPRGTGTA